jgi:hypothetical protein
MLLSVVALEELALPLAGTENPEQELRRRREETIATRAKVEKITVGSIFVESIFPSGTGRSKG